MQCRGCLEAVRVHIEDRRDGDDSEERREEWLTRIKRRSIANGLRVAEFMIS